MSRQAGEWFVADSFYESVDPSYFHSKSQSALDGWKEMSAAACDHPVAFACEALFPGVVKAFRNPRDAEAWGRAAFDVALFAVPVLKACQVGRLANVGKFGRVGYEVGNSGLILNRFHQSAYNLTEIGQNNIRILRGWAKSKGWEKMPKAIGAPETWGQYNQLNSFDWRLKIKPEPSFREGLEANSNIPRASARLKNGVYINPFTGEIGGTNVGKHIPLEELFYK